jgi:membrane-bound serine protease (ClpP class)
MATNERHAKFCRASGISRLFLILLGHGIILAAALLPAQSEAQSTEPLVIHIRITGTIDLGLAPFLSRTLAEAERDGATAVILEIDTPGGRLDAVLQMKDA